MPPSYWQKARAELAASDPVMAMLVARYEGSIRSRGAPFETLLRAIVGQQISVKAADAVWGRLQALLGEVLPEHVLAFDPQALREAGLSARKAEYVVDLALHWMDGRLAPETFPDKTDDEIIADLTAVRGIGRWTAEMFLMFNLNRPDVWPVDDIGIQKAVALHYLEGVRPTLAALREVGERWRPWRTVASWYLWRSLDPDDIAY
ncbi:DNA-3-methyladenine glycosylase family protein [Gulbenkiania mobilis]|uniref:DNA-3-methyladenine glycosylase family protein n=1 Tax=Gulbenkiania mobilis TaxID=397457 RepID=UPI0006BBF19C|nr:DNA-3-methyladenine glycosylase [Gulbenkiania mobilis]